MSKQKIRFSICLMVGIWDATSSATYSQGRSPHISQSINQSSINQDPSGKVPYSVILMCVASITETNHNNRCMHYMKVPTKDNQ